MTITATMLSIGLLAASASAQLADNHELPDLKVVPVSIQRGNVASSFGNDAIRFERTDVFKAAEAAQVDLRNPVHPFLAFSYRNNRLFYLFYNDVMHIPEKRYLIQRIKRTKINYPRNGKPEESVDYQVEAMKSANGHLKKPDQHFGSYGLRGFEKRTIFKEFEVGCGTIDDHDGDGSWPFDPGVLFEQLQPYSQRKGLYDRIAYERSKTWTLTVSFDRAGNYEFRSAELEIEVVWKLPSAQVLDSSNSNSASRPAAGQGDDNVGEVVLEEGKGLWGILVGESRREDVERRLGPAPAQERSAAALNLRFPQGITFNIPDDRPVNTIFSEPGFLGRTSKGIRHGDDKSKILELYGKPRGQTAETLSYNGVLFWLDRSGRVKKIVIWRDDERERR
jgi:hypothetical protein